MVMGSLFIGHWLSMFSPERFLFELFDQRQLCVYVKYMNNCVNKKGENINFENNLNKRSF